MPVDKKKQVIEQREGILRTFLKFYPNHPTDRIVRAMDYAELLHRGQLRKSGLPYIVHPLSVAHIAAENQLDEKCIIIALLHDTIEDTVASRESVAKKFDEDIAQLVEALTKIRRYSMDRSVVDKQGTYQRILEAASRDIRPLIIKIFDRLNNMREMEHMSEEAQQRISRETLDVYVPLARRLGMRDVETELANLSLGFLYSDRVALIRKRLDADRERTGDRIREIAEVIVRKCQEHEIVVEVDGRWPEIFDFYHGPEGVLNPNADIELHVGVTAEEPLQLYGILGVLHSMFAPVPKELRDTIASPMANGYRAIESKLLIDSRRYHFAICTPEMNQMNRRGIIYNWRSNQNRLSSYFTNYMRLLGELLADEDVRVDEVLQQSNVDGIYVYSPRKEPYFLPYNSTAMDFAYEVHRDVGDHARKAIINGMERPVSQKLASGDVVEIVTGKTPVARKNWNSFVTTPKAKAAIKRLHNKEVEMRSIELGQQMFFFELEKYGRDARIVVGGADFKKILDKEGLSLNEFYRRIWDRQIISSRFIMQHGIVPKNQVDKQRKVERASIRSKIFSSLKNKSGPKCRLTQNDIFVNFAQCCKPVIGDKVVGIVNAGKGISVHRDNCPNIREMPVERRVVVEWDMDRPLEEAVLNLQVMDEPGVLAKILAAVKKYNINITEFDAKTISTDEESRAAVLKFRLDLSNQRELLRVVKDIRKLDAVVAITHEE